MVKLELNNVNTNKLHDELIAHGIVPVLVQSKEDTTWITVKDNQIDAVNTVVANHNPTPYLPQPTETEMLMDYIVDVDFRVVLLELGLI